VVEATALTLPLALTRRRERGLEQPPPATQEMGLGLLPLPPSGRGQG
jgi:hypothetical protein